MADVPQRSAILARIWGINGTYRLQMMAFSRISAPIKAHGAKDCPLDPETTAMARRTTCFLSLTSAMILLCSPRLGAQSSSWTVRYDGGSNDEIAGVATDSTGDLAVTGRSKQNVVPNQYTFYTAKYAGSNGQLRWEFKKPAGIGNDYSHAVAMDREGNVLVTGEVAAGLGGDIYTAKYAASDGHLLWEKSYNGTGNNNDVGNAIAVDAAGDVVVTGFSVGGAPAGAGMYTAKYASADGRLMWQHFLRGPSNEIAFAYNVKVDAAGDVVVLGTTRTAAGIDRILCVKYSGSSGSILWQRQASLQGYGYASALAFDASNNVCITGAVGSPGTQLYVAKFASANGAVLWQTFYDRPGRDHGVAIDVDLHGDVIVTGDSALFDGGTADIYTAKYSGKDGVLLWDRRVDRQPARDEGGSAVVLDAIGNVFAICNGHRGTDMEVYIAKYGSGAGTLLSEQTYNGPNFNDDYLNAGGAVATPEGGFAMAVLSRSTPSNLDYATVKRVPAASTEAPQLSGIDVSNITTTSARFQAVALSTQADAVVDVYVNDTLQKRFDVKAGGGEVRVSLDVSNLLPHTVYTFRAVALSVGHAPQQQGVEFRTLNTAPTAQSLTIHASPVGISSSVYSTASHTNDADGDTRSLQVIGYTGSGSVSTDGAVVTYSNAGFVGSELITIRVTDGFGGVADATVTLENKAPETQGKVLHAPKTGVSTVIFTASSESSDADSDPRTVSVLSYTGNGQATSDGSEVTFINGGFVGEEVITVRVSDGRGGYADAAISLKNTGPNTTDKSFHAPPLGSSLVVFQVNADSTDPDNDSRVVAIVGSNGAGSVNTDGTDVTYKNNGLAGAETIVLRVTDERGGVANATVRISNQAPIATNALITWPGTSPLEIGVLPLASDPDGDGVSILAFGAPAYGALVGSDAGTITYVPGDAFEGRDAFTYTVQDDRGAHAVATIQVQSTSKSYRSIAAVGEPVPGAGEVGSGIPAGAVWDAFGPPSLIGSELGWLGTFKTPDAKFSGVFSGEPEAPTLGIKTGDTAVDEAGVAMAGKTFRQFGQPVFSTVDKFAVKGKLRGKGIGEKNDEAIWVMTGGSLRRVAAEGAVAPGTEGARFSGFSSIVFTEEGVLYLVARLQAGGRISAMNDLGLWRWTESEGLALLLREGMSIQSGPEEAKLRSFTTLSSVKRSSGEGRYDAASSLLPMRLSLSSKLESIAMIHPDGSLEMGPFTTSTFGAPDISSEEGEGAVLEKLPLGAEGVTSGNRWQITDIKTDQSLARSMGAAPGIDGAVFAKFLDPVSGRINSNTLTAFIAEVRVAGRVGKTNQRSGIWTRTHEDGEDLKLLAEQGGVAPETGGERFAEFVSLAVLPDYGPVFKAKLARSSTVRRQNDEGLWAVDSSGTLRLILREGDPIFVGGQGKRLVSFSTLDTVLDSPAQRRTFGNDPGRLVCRAKFDDGKTAIVRVTVP